MQMFCRITDMHDKEVINVCDGTRIGCVDDVEVDTCTAQLVSIVVHGRPKCMGLLGHDEDIVISWKEIEVIGEETILVNHPLPPCCPGPRPRKNGILGGIFGGK
jgi:sporulation protein, ylmC/ymxH family